MLRMTKLLPALALMGALAPLAANARAAGGLSHQPAERLVQLYNPRMAPAFSMGRMGELPNRGEAIHPEAVRDAFMNDGGMGHAARGIRG